MLNLIRVSKEIFIFKRARISCFQVVMIGWVSWETHILLLLLDVHDNDKLSASKGHQMLPQCVEAVDGYSKTKNANCEKPNSTPLYYLELYP